MNRVCARFRSIVDQEYRGQATSSGILHLRLDAHPQRLISIKPHWRPRRLPPERLTALPCPAVGCQRPQQAYHDSKQGISQD
jgi:hypothetical protein